MFVDGDKSKDIVEKNEAEISRRAVKYMKETYKTDVKVNNVVPARSAAVVMVEAEEPIQFHTSVIVELDMKKKALDPEEANVVRSTEGEVEKAIVSGLYAKAYSSELQNLDEFIHKTGREYSLYGQQEEAIDKTASSGYQTAHYFISLSALKFPEVYEEYLKNQDISDMKIRAMFDKRNPENILIPISFYSQTNKLPSEKLPKSISHELRHQTRIPKCRYNIQIFKNSIVNRVRLPDGEGVFEDDIKIQ
ncbi:DUF1672 family protein [Listeria fleischmannii]|nr:DUF1672 family protein [Listeria fleischmannii]